MGKNKNQNTTPLVSVARTQVYKRQSPGMPVHQEFCHVSKSVKAWVSSAVDKNQLSWYNSSIPYEIDFKLKTIGNKRAEHSF